MVAVKLQNFGGMIPAMDAELLPPNHAAENRNSWLYTGALEGIRVFRPVHTLVNLDTRRVYRIPLQSLGKENIPDSFWMEFPVLDVDVINSPTIDDTFERFYWAGQGIAPQYNTRARIINGDPAFVLGVPAPEVAPGVSVTGGAAPVETRAYVYTYVSAYGEESAPSPAILTSGNASGTWDVTVTDPDAGVLAGRNLDAIRIYRTVTGSAGATSFFFVAEIALGVGTYADTSDTVTVTGNRVLETTFWNPPPTDLAGMTSLPNGNIAGFRNNEIWFCEPYRPHAWPSIYTVAVEFPIMGLGVIGQSLIVCTTSNPYSISGINPANMSMSKISAIEPCTSRGSIVSTPNGVVYASPNGLAVAVPGSVQVVTRNLITNDLWADPEQFLNISTLRAASIGNAYYAWGTEVPGCFDPGCFEPTTFLQGDFLGAYQGALIDVSDARIGYTKLVTDDPMANCFTDYWTGEVLVIRDGMVQWLDLDVSQTRGPYLWRSKIMETPNQRNFGAMRIYFRTYADTPPLNPVRNTSQVQPELAADQWGLLRLYADDRLVYVREIRESGEIFKLPSGFKATFWQIEVEARVRINSIEIASTAKELQSV